jgi:hypothetical protein
VIIKSFKEELKIYCSNVSIPEAAGSTLQKRYIKDVIVHEEFKQYRTAVGELL